MSEENRPAKITELKSWLVTCELCVFEMDYPTHQEASICLTRHLDTQHPGWNESEPQ